MTSPTPISLADGYVNFAANLGTERDKATGAGYAMPLLSPAMLENAYRSAWLPRKIVDIPAQDMTRKWRGWQAEREQITLLEREEKRLGVRGKVRQGVIKARLSGGAGIFIGTGDPDPSKPLIPERIGKGGVKYLVVLDKSVLTSKEIERDVLLPGYGRPKLYQMTSVNRAQLDIHPSRIVRLIGSEVPEQAGSMGWNDGWGDSTLLSIMQAIESADGTMANLAALVFEAKVDIFSVQNLMSNLQADTNRRYETALLNRFSLAARSKSINGALVMDRNEEYNSKSASFASLPDVADRFLQAVSGAADIPATRLLGMSPAGMNASGESDLRNYYDRLQSAQELDLGPEMEILDECLIRSALGSRPEEIYYAWKPLWQLTAEQKATRDKTVADTLKTLKDANMFPVEALARAAATTVVEHDIVPGLEAAIKEYGDKLPDEEAEIRADEQAKAAVAAAKGTATAATQTAAKPRTRAAVKDGQPRSLYVSRDVLNGDEIVAWAKSQGFASTLAVSDLHVTIAYSRTPIDWMKLGGDDWGGEGGGLTVGAGGPRVIEQFDGGAIVLAFSSSRLSWRHEGIKEAGASWDFPDYTPHITITYEPGEVDVSKVVPYRGEIKLGPEIFAELDDDWKSTEKET